MSAELITQGETSFDQAKAQQSLNSIETHVGRNHSQVHVGTLKATNGLYKDSGGQTWVNSANPIVLSIVISGTTYYIPCKLLADA